ncbi:DMT family transporter [Helicobacter vulpis]|uniref:DMT family transporter n=1 Tax=Helicobacter vulpis TaxID=2316076 RepID=UPI000EB06559|nr:DMT family transporter [Helicobacter vulpis]
MNIKLGLFYMALSALNLGLMSALIKLMSGYYSPVENVFYRSTFMLVFLLLFYYFKPFCFRARKKGGGWLLLGRMMIGAIGMVLFCYNISTMPLGTATAFNQSAPLYAIIIAALIFKEPVGLRLFLAGFLGLLGVICIANPHTSGLAWAQIFCGVLNGLLVAIAYSSLYRLKEYYDGAFVVFIFSLCLSVLGFLGFFIDLPPLSSGYHPMRFGGAWWGWDVWVFAGIGLFGTCGQYFLTKAYMNAPAGVISPMNYTRLVWSVIFGIMLGDRWLGMLEGVGMGLIVLSGILTTPIKAHKTSSR